MRLVLGIRVIKAFDKRLGRIALSYTTARPAFETASGNCPLSS